MVGMRLIASSVRAEVAHARTTAERQSPSALARHREAIADLNTFDKQATN